MLEGADLVKMAVALFVIADPFGAVPIFVTLTARHTPAERARIALIAAGTAVTLLTLTVFAGGAVLTTFGISIASFRVVGGILFLLIAFEMLNVRQSRTRHTPEEESEAGQRHEIGFVPLGIPLLAGPGAISTVLLMSAQAPEPAGKAMVLGVIFGVMFTIYVLLRLAVPIAALLGRTGTNIMTRLMGLVTGAIGVEMLAAGVKALFPGLGPPPA
jgi:multiple antibiotic resistance protein